MRKTLVVLTAAALLAGACSKKTGGGVKLKTDTDSVAYVIGMNVGMNLMKMDSTINVNAVCEGIRDVFRQGEPQLRPHRIGRDLYGRGAGRSGADTRFGP